MLISGYLSYQELSDFIYNVLPTMKQKNWIDILGVPQGDEVVHGNMISRKIDHNTYQRLWSFDHPEHAQQTYDIWMDQYAEIKFTDGEKK